MACVVEWALVAPGKIVIAVDDGNYWVYRPSASEPGNPFVAAMTRPGTLATTKTLLEGAIVAGVHSGPPQTEPPTLTLPRVVKQLAAAFQTTHATPAVFRAAAERFAEMGRRDLADFAEVKAREETGHDRLALKDLEALGLPAESIVDVLRPPSGVALASYFAECARSDNPVTCFGYCYCLEWIASLRGPDDIARVRSVCPPGVDATRFLRVHSSVGSDASHVVEMVDFISGLPADDRTSIVRAAYESAALMSKQFELDAALGDAEIRRTLVEIGAELPTEP